MARKTSKLRIALLLLVFACLIFVLFRNPPDTAAIATFTRNIDPRTATINAPDLPQPKVVHLFARPEVIEAGKELENWRKNYQPKQPEFPPLVTLKGEAFERVPNGHSLILGGWETKPGRRLMVFVTPKAQDNRGNASSHGTNVLIKSRLIEVDFSRLKANNLDWLLDPEKAYTLDADRVKAVVERLEKLEGTDLLSAPQVQLSSGSEANVSVGGVAPGGGHFGPSIWMIPEVKSSENAVDLGLRVEIGLLPESDSQK